jgi:hypothetical protein
MAFRINPLSKIIGLSGMLALGFLMIVLSTALYGSWMPILDGLLFSLAHIPYLLTNLGSSSEYQTGFDDISAFTGNNVADFGKWISSFLVTSGIALPVVLCRSKVLTTIGSGLSIVGGLCIYITIILFTTFFDGFATSDDPFSM